MAYALESLLVALLGISAVVHAAEEHSCTNKEGFEAEATTDHLDSWKKIHLAFQQYSNCDDGGVAEGFSDAVVRLLAHKWHDLPQLEKLIDTDPQFERFVLRHIDATTDDDDLHSIERLSKVSCPARSKALCAKIHTASTSAISEL